MCVFETVAGDMQVADQFHGQESKTLQRLVILPKRDMSTFLSEMDDGLSLASLCLPGTFISSMAKEVDF